MPTQKTEKRKFQTLDVVALYFGKTFDKGGKQMVEVRKIAEFLIGIKNFDFSMKSEHNQIRQILINKFEWLRTLGTNHSDFENWKANLLKNHHEELLLTK